MPFPIFACTYSRYAQTGRFSIFSFSLKLCFINSCGLNSQCDTLWSFSLRVTSKNPGNTHQSEQSEQGNNLYILSIVFIQ